jgi:hypothetical protein
MPLDLDLPLIERYRESHHSIARMIAMGQTDSMIRRNTGLSLRRLALLKASPSFIELIEFYGKQIHEKVDAAVDAYIDLGVSNMLRSETMIADHLDAAQDQIEAGEPNPIPITILDRLSQGRADRFGYSKHSIVHHDHDFAAALDRAIERTRPKEIEGTVIEAEVVARSPNHVLPPPPRERVEPPHTPPPARSFATVLAPRIKKLA